MIKAGHLSKKYGNKIAVDDLSLEVATGKVTGFLGPNGAGKSTTMRLMLGLDNGSGTTTYDGKPLHQFNQPSTIIGILLEAKAFHPTRSARNHLRVLAAEAGVSKKRVDEVVDLVGLGEVAKKAPGKFSLGMSQRLGLAAAILGKPKYLILDEPANGLDPEGIAWLRQFIKDYAKDGNGILVSSHILSEVAQMADNVIVIGKGKLITEGSVAEITRGRAHSQVILRVDEMGEMKTALKNAELDFKTEGDQLIITDATTDKIGELAHKAGVSVMELSSKMATLEEAFLELTTDSQEFKSQPQKKAKRWKLL